MKKSNTSFDPARREILRAGAAASVLGTAAPFALQLAGMSSASAQQAPDYKALVCVFLFGGNDAHDTVLATDTATFGAYSAVRGGYALKDNAVLPLVLRQGSRHGARSFALHPATASLAELFNGLGGDQTRRRLAVVPNVGTLLAPTSKAQYAAQSVPLPPMLFSHNDQFNMWQAGGPEGATRGWGGLFGDQVMAQNGAGSVFTCISPAGTAIWLSGNEAVQYQVLPVTGEAVRIQGRDSLYGSTQAANAFKDILNREGGLFESEYKKVVQRSISAQQTIANAFGNVTVGNAPAGNNVASQLRAVARLIKAANSGGLPGVKRQVFFVSASGYDTHNNQFVGSQGGVGNHAALLGTLAQALRYFHDELGEGLIDKVTTFTASDFGRTLKTNSDGTDHGWGGHHFVMGGAVDGGEIYGQWPDLSAASEDLVELGRNLIPRVSVDQYGATLGRWFGLSDQQLSQVFPNLAAFPNSSYPHDLGFLKTVSIATQRR
jgi:uncharacterized protein (DUF1501 family)